MDEKEIITENIESAAEELSPEELNTEAVGESGSDEQKEVAEIANDIQDEKENKAAEELSPEELKEKVKKDIKKERKENIIEWIKDIFIAAILASIILTFFKPIIVQQESMLNTYYPGDYIIISRQAYNLFGDPERGDVIVFKTDMEDENGAQKNLIKRIIGLPGDKVEVREDGYIYINGELLDEPYVKEQGISADLFGTVDVTVGENELFVCGDNREVSLDSRSIGCISQDQIMGKVKILVLNTQGMRKGQ